MTKTDETMTKTGVRAKRIKLTLGGRLGNLWGRRVSRAVGRFARRQYRWITGPSSRHLSVALVVLGVLGLLVALPQTAHAQMVLPKVDFQLTQARTPQDVSNGIQILVLLTVLTLAPALIIMTTSFTRIIIVLALLRQAIGTAQLPPNQVLAGLAIILTFFVMSPTFAKINETALDPYMKGRLPQATAMERAMVPIRSFMFRQTHEKDIELFMGLAKLSRPKNAGDVPTHVLLPAFVISELKTGFQLGFVIFLPFIIIDILVSSVLVSMGMMFLPPMSISLPFKIILFVLVDGWQLISKALVQGFVT